MSPPMGVRCIRYIFFCSKWTNDDNCYTAGSRQIRFEFFALLGSQHLRDTVSQNWRWQSYPERTRTSRTFEAKSARSRLLRRTC